MNNKKLTANEIIELFDLNGIGIYEFVEGEYEPEDIVDEDGEVVAIGEVVEVSREEEVTDGWGYDIIVVNHFKDHDVYIKTEGHYQSYDGTSWENGYGSEVRPKEKTITVYE